MKVSHWSLQNGSGLHGVAASLVTAEQALGLDATLIDSTVESDAWEQAVTADVHVVHSHMPNQIQDRLRRSGKPSRVVWVGHGTPDHIFQSAVEYSQTGGYGHPEPLMLMQHWLQRADACVTFWPRHQWIYQRMVDRRTVVDCVPMGVDTAFWSAGTSAGKFDGTPSVFTAENPHYIKWPYDLVTLWADVAESLAGGMAKLHAVYLPRDMHSQFFPWMFRTDAAYYGFFSPMVFDQPGLRNAFQSTDVTIGLVRYGDVNLLSLQANAAGATTISYRGNPYADYWLTEGDQREMARELTAILQGDVSKRAKSPVPDIAETATAMRGIYDRILTTSSP